MEDFEFKYEEKNSEMPLIEWRELTREIDSVLLIETPQFSLSKNAKFILVDDEIGRAIFQINDEENKEKIAEGMRILRAICRKLKVSGNVSALTIIDSLKDEGFSLKITHLEQGRVFALI